MARTRKKTTQLMLGTHTAIGTEDHDLGTYATCVKRDQVSVKRDPVSVITGLGTEDHDFRPHAICTIRPRHLRVWV